MSRVLLPVTNIAPTGIVLDTYLIAAEAAGNSFPIDADQKTIFVCKNGAGAPITLTFRTPPTVGGVAVAEQTVTVTNAKTEVVSNFPKSLFQQTDGSCYVDYSAVTTITVAVLKLP
jgi:hypothetical protein